MQTPCLAANFSNACLESMVSAADLSIWRCTKCNQEKWSTKTVQYLYRFFVRDPFNWVKKPTSVSVDSIWLTGTISPGLVESKIL
jgi:hypothetical protein